MIYQRDITEPAFNNNNGVEFETTKWRYWIPKEIFEHTDNMGLIIDDYVLSGDTFLNLSKELNKKGLTFKTAGLICGRESKRTKKLPDYHYFIADTPDVYMPWGHADKQIRIGADAT